MHKRIASWIIGIAFIMAVLLAQSSAQAQQAESQNDGVYSAGSFIFSVFYLPLKLATCVGTQVVAGTAYIATFQTPGNYEGGTNGREIGEVARGACSGPWIISPEDVKRDYQ